MYTIADKMTLTVCYKSVFDDLWTVERGGFKTNLEQSTYNKVTSCDIQPEELFNE